MRFPVITADPPWQYKTWSKKGQGRSAEHHYDTQPPGWIKSLPVKDVAAPDCTLFLWATAPCMPQAFETLDAWGFKYKTIAFDWMKTNKDGSPRMGMGHWTRANNEFVLLATRGKPKRISRSVRMPLVTKYEAHSRKPEEMYCRVEQLVAGPYLELFSRPRPGCFWWRENWTQIGNEITGRSLELDIADLAADRVLPSIMTTDIYVPMTVPVGTF